MNDIYQPPKTEAKRLKLRGDTCPFCQAKLTSGNLKLKMGLRGYRYLCANCKNLLNYRFPKLVTLPGDVVTFFVMLFVAAFGVGLMYRLSLWLGIPLLLLILGINHIALKFHKFCVIRLAKIIHYT